MSAKVFDPAPRYDVMQEQFDFLMEHNLRSLERPKMCARKGKLCQNCLRYIALKELLLQPFAAGGRVPRTKAIAA